MKSEGKICYVETSIKGADVTDETIELAVKFAMSNQSFASVIIGAKNVKQLEENMRIESLVELNDIQLTHLKKRYKDFTLNCNTR